MIPVFPTAYFGSIGYFKALAQYSHVIIEAKEHFPKQTYRNRCDVIGANGPLSISIPVIRNNGSKTATDQILVSNNENWRARHWRTIRSAYQSAPYFDYYGMEVEELVFQDVSSLLDLNLSITRRITDWLDLDVQLTASKEFTPEQENDPRRHLVSKKELQDHTKAPYIQVFPSDNGFYDRLSILDAIMCEGPLARNLLINS